MASTFDTVDQKIAEVEFFLQKMSSAKFDIFAFNCYLSAYLAAARTATLCLQRFSHVPGFTPWYEAHQAALKESPLAKFFLETRNSHLHGGDYPVSGGSVRDGISTFYFSTKYSEPESGFVPGNVLQGCRDFFLVLLDIVYDCYVALGPHIDPQQHYTKEHFNSLGKNIDNAETEIFGWIKTSLIKEGLDEDARWHELRGYVGECTINHLFHSYLGKATPQPEVPEHYHDFEPSTEDRGWVYIPAGFASVEEYIESLTK